MPALLRFSFRSLFLALVLPLLAGAAETPLLVGVARVDITPELPIRLSGYQGGARQAETNRIERRLFARALAIGSDQQKPVVLITVEVIGLSEELSSAVAAALRASHGLERECVAICATHTHTGPAIRGVLPFMFAQDLPADEAARIDRYTTTLREKLIQVATAALA